MLLSEVGSAQKRRCHLHREVSISRSWIRPTTNPISRPRSWRRSRLSPPAAWWCLSMRGAARRPNRRAACRASVSSISGDSALAFYATHTLAPETSGR